MNDKKLHALYNLKFNPFSQQVPAEALRTTPAIETFCWRIENQTGEGGFALAIGDPGTGKSAALRILARRLAQHRDLITGELTRPQASLADFYRELGHLYGVPLTPHNRWAGAKTLREKWLHHIDTTLQRPVLLIDNAEEMNPATYSELRLLSSADLDSRNILTIVFAGDHRLAARLDAPELLPIASRVRTRLRAEALPPQQLRETLDHLTAAAGNPRLLADTLAQTLCEHAAGNLRLLINLGNDLLSAALRDERETLDETLYFEVFDTIPKPKRPRR
jgi:general secretion pathway protein A